MKKKIFVYDHGLIWLSGHCSNLSSFRKLLLSQPYTMVVCAPTHPLLTSTTAFRKHLGSVFAENEHTVQT
jgi:hypothetical protein